MLRRGVDLLAVALLDDLAEVHDGDPVAEVAHDAEVVGDEDEGEAELLAQVPSRFITWAWIETSRADTGSSAMITFGSTASARAMPMRWR